MPYVFQEELNEGQTEADVVERSEYESLNTQLQAALDQRDQAIERAVKAEGDYGKMRQKYADTFLNKAYNPQPLPNDNRPITAQSMDDLFKED